MKYITLIDCSYKIENAQYRALYLSKLAYVERALFDLERIGVPGKVIFNCEVVGKKLLTQVEVECEDQSFRNVLSEATKSFNA